MKKWYAIPGVLAVASLLLLHDLYSFFSLVKWNPAEQVYNAGTALYVFGGLFEINDRIPYSAASDYFWGLCAAVAVCVLLTAAGFLLVHRFSRTAR